MLVFLPHEHTIIDQNYHSQPSFSSLSQTAKYTTFLRHCSDYIHISLTSTIFLGHLILTKNISQCWSHPCNETTLISVEFNGHFSPYLQLLMKLNKDITYFLFVNLNEFQIFLKTSNNKADITGVEISPESQALQLRFSDVNGKYCESADPRTIFFFSKSFKTQLLTCSSEKYVV